MDTFAVLDVQTRVNVDEIAELDSQIVASDFVHLDSTFLDVIRAQANEDSVSPFFATAGGLGARKKNAKSDLTG
jgi:hypothetical protein